MNKVPKVNKYYQWNTFNAPPFKIIKLNQDSIKYQYEDNNNLIHTCSFSTFYKYADFLPGYNTPLWRLLNERA